MTTDQPIAPKTAQGPQSVRARFSRENCVIAALLVAAAALRVLNVFNYRVDSDEPQHLHVVWAWAGGLLQYRDVFDNHAPLFQMLCAPLMRALGERADIIIPMRLAMVPLYLGCLWCVYEMGRTLWSRRVGMWAAVFAALEPRFFLTSTEFRTDDLWVLAWLLVLLVLVKGRLTVRRALGFGLLLGAAFSVSLKTSLLLAMLGAAAALALFLNRRAGGGFPFRRLAGRAGLALAGAVVVPGALVLWFAAHHAVHEMFYCVLRHNMVPGIRRWGHLPGDRAWFPVLLPVILAGAWWMFRHAPSREIGMRRVVLMVSAWLYVAFLRSYWPEITHEDFLPFSPLAMLVATPLALDFAHRVSRHRDRSWPVVPLGFVAAGLTGLILQSDPPWHNSTRKHIETIATALRLTRPGEFVMDSKSGAIFRQRPFFYVLETMTRARIDNGTIKDDVIGRMTATRTAVVSVDLLLTGLPVLKFIKQNYLILNQSLGVGVLGQVIKPPAGGGDDYAFDVAVPGDYVLVCENGALAGTLDGAPLGGVRQIGAGHHVLHKTRGEGRVALFWARAWREGFSPFTTNNPRQLGIQDKPRFFK